MRPHAADGGRRPAGLPTRPCLRTMAASVENGPAEPSLVVCGPPDTTPPASVHLRASRGTRGAQICRESSARGVARRPRPHCIDATQRRGGGQIPELSVAMVLAYLRHIYALVIIKIKAPTRYSAAWTMIARWGRPTQKHAETRCSFTMLSQPLRSPRDPPPSLRV